MADAPESPSAAAVVERRIVSVLFADLVGFTPLSERLDSEDVATIQDRYFDATRDTIARYGGTVEKFIGDAVMAVFGAPRAHDDDAERAVRAGLALIAAVQQLNARLGLDPDALQLRVGVNTGEVVHATSGTDAGRVTGDTVNTAARLQAAARPGSVLVGELTALAVADGIETVAIGGIELKGKADPVRAWEAAGIRADPSRETALGALRAPTLGREPELARLRAAAVDVADPPRSARILIVAPPGVGKSRLLAELGASTEGDLRRARVRPQATAPFETVAQLFDGVDLATLEDRLTAAGTPASRAAVIADEIRRLRDPEAPVDTPAAGALAVERDARFDAWVSALDAADDGVATWLLEDVHWAGPDLLAFLDLAGRSPTRRGRLVVTTARPSLLETAPAWCEVERIDLRPLGATDAAALVRALVGEALPETLVAGVVERSDGTPLFIEELIRTWASVGTLVAEADAGGHWRLAVQPENVALPATVQAIYAAQLDDLPAAARAVARRGSVAGRRVPTAALGRLDLADARDGIETLRRRDFLAGPLSDEITGESFAYRHALLRDAGYASLARVERARLHLAMAAWLEEAAGDRVDVVAEAIAEHHAQARDSLPSIPPPDLPDAAALAVRAAGWYERAALAALGLSAHEAARRHLERSLELTRGDAADDVARRSLALGRLLAETSDLDAGIGHLESALRLSADGLPGMAGLHVDAAYALGRAYMQQVRFDEAGEVASGALSTLDAGDASLHAGRARLMALHAWSVSALGRTDRVLDEARAAEELAATVGDPGVELDVLEHTSAARSEVGEHEPGTWDEIARRARALGRWHLAVVAMRLGAAEGAEDDARAALPGIEAAAELAQAHGMTEQAGWCELGRSEALFVTGDWDRAIEAGLRAIDVAERFAYIRLAFRTWIVLLPMLAARRDASLLARHDAWWPDARSHFPSTPSPYGSILAGAIAVWRAQALGRPVPMPDPALASLNLVFSNPHVLAAMEAVADAWREHGRADLVRTLVAQPLDDDATALMRTSRALIRGSALGERDHAELAAEEARRIGAAWWQARALHTLGDPAAATLEDRLGI